MSERVSICITLTSPFFLNAFLLGHIARLSASFHVVVCVNRLESVIPIKLPAGAELHHVEIRREVDPFRDLLALWRLVLFYRSSKFAAVISVTPKGGLLAMLAARLTGVQVRVHCFTGQVWATKTGMAREFLKGVDRLLVFCATSLLADSPSQREYLIGERIVAPGKIAVIGDGSISGVNLTRFRADAGARRAIRDEIGLPAQAVCLLYVGRMKRDKGIPELLEAFKLLKDRHSDLHLLLVGPDEEGMVTDHRENRFHYVGYTQKVETYMAAADIICLPSHREGFGTVLIEAAAVGLPAVASRTYGITDAVSNGETGLLHPAGSAEAIAACIERLLTDPVLFRRLSRNAGLRATELFAAERVETLFADWIQTRIAAHGPATGDGGESKQ